MGLSYSIPGKLPSDIPRRLFCPPLWDSASLYYWTVIMVLVVRWLDCTFSTCLDGILYWKYSLSKYLGTQFWKSWYVLEHCQLCRICPNPNIIHLCSKYPSIDDSRSILLQPVYFANDTTEGVQSQKPIYLPLWYLVAGNQSTKYDTIYISCSSSQVSKLFWALSQSIVDTEFRLSTLVFYYFIL